MADIVYPSTLPCMLSGTLLETSVDPWVADRGEVGAADRRKRFTRKLLGFSYELRLTTEQKAELLSFYDDTLNDGVKAFNWVHPWTGVTYEVQFAGRPQVKHRSNRIWFTEIALEQI